MNALVGPGTHARRYQQVDRIVRRVLLEELQRAVHATRFVAVNPTRDEHHRAVITPAAVAQRELAVVVRRIVELSVLLHIEAPGEALDAGHDLVVVAPEFSLPR